MISVLAATTLWGCREAAAPRVGVASVRITARADSLEAGDSLQLAAALADSAGTPITGRTVLWSSLDSTILRVTSSGLATGLRPGLARVVVVVDRAYDTTTLKVLVPIASIRILWRVPALVVSDTVRLVAWALDYAGNGLPRVITWSASDSSALRLSASSLLSALAQGATVVTARAGTKRDTLTVRAVRVSYVSLSPATNHTCGVTTTGDMFCWGLNSVGQLGVISPQGSQVRPGLVTGGLSYVAVSAWDGTCGLAAYGVVYCWYWVGLTTPSQVTSLPASSALSEPCALVPGGQAYCWGEGLAPAATPVNQNPPLVFTKISYPCGLGGDSLVYCWESPPGPAWALPGSLKFVSLSVHGGHGCALTPGGAAYCWGYNYVGQLGNGTTDSSATPVAGAGGHTFSAISAGDEHTCGIEAGTAYCWGDNTFGELGIGSTAVASYHTPQPVAGGLAFGSIFAGYRTTCGLTTAGVAYCWGENDYGMVGDGTQALTAAPAKVAGQM